MAQTLGQQLDEVQTALSAARQAISYKKGDNEVHRSYIQLQAEKKELLSKIETYGANYIEGQSTTPKKASANVSFS